MIPPLFEVFSIIYPSQSELLENPPDDQVPGQPFGHREPLKRPVLRVFGQQVAKVEDGGEPVVLGRIEMRVLQNTKDRRAP